MRYSTYVAIAMVANVVHIHCEIGVVYMCSVRANAFTQSWQTDNIYLRSNLIELIIKVCY